MKLVLATTRTLLADLTDLVDSSSWILVLDWADSDSPEPRGLVRGSEILLEDWTNKQIDEVASPVRQREEREEHVVILFDGALVARTATGLFTIIADDDPLFGRFVEDPRLAFELTGDGQIPGKPRRTTVMRCNAVVEGQACLYVNHVTSLVPLPRCQNPNIRRHTLIP